jgi:hypothetical protein
MKHTTRKSNGMKRQMLLLPVFLVAVVALVFTMPGTASAWETIELDEAKVFIEWNSRDDDYGIHFFWDGEPWKRMRVRNHRGKKVLDVRTRKNLRQQGLTEGFFESAEPETSELSLAEFLERFPEGEYTFRGRSNEGDRLVGEAEFTHNIPDPPNVTAPTESGNPADIASIVWDAGGPDIVGYEVVAELVLEVDDEEIVYVNTATLPGTATMFTASPEFVALTGDPDLVEAKVEVIAIEESGNKTITEVVVFEAP